MMQRFHLPAAVLVCVVGVLAAAGCSSAQTGGAVSDTAPNRERIALPASFEGVLPCADCEGIRYHHDLFEDEVY